MPPPSPAFSMALPSSSQLPPHNTGYFTSLKLLTYLCVLALLLNADDGDVLGEPLTARETELLDLLSKGKSNQEIAAALSICLSTVENHLSHIYGKLRVKNCTGAVAWYLGNKGGKPRRKRKK